MPRATIDVNETFRHELKTLEGGFVVLKRMSYGKLLDRQSDAMSMKMSGKGDSAEADIRLMGRQTAVLEFKECITDHNLEDDSGNKLNFSNPSSLDVLHPAVGEEIGTLLNKLNRFEDELGN